MITSLFLFFLLALKACAYLEVISSDQDTQNRELRRFGFWSWRDRPIELFSCTSTSDCGGGHYCSAGQCRKFGDCGTVFDCRNPENTYSVTECTGPLKFKCDDEGKCGRDCGIPCENGTGGFQCVLDPCSIAEDSCETKSFKSCLADYCRSCYPLVFNAAGNYEECTGPDIIPNNSTCSRSSDCDDEQYCSFGECRSFGKCSKDVDCFNPDNFYPIIECVGPISCDDSGMCGRTCTGSFCPDDKPPDYTCSSQCADLRETCDETFEFCMDDNCGGCNAIAFDDSGTQVCTVTECANSLDCRDKLQYCAGGKCLFNGSCETDLDCKNPNNVYSSIDCVGVLWCDSGTCGIECGPSICAHGGPPVNCFAQPCAVTQCDEDHAFCIDDYCNGCDAIFLDEAGREVCNGGPSP